MQKQISLKNVSIPALGFGTWKLEGPNAVDCVSHAIHTGYRHIDTAQAYENEKEVGEGIRKSGIQRDEIFLTTKVWMDRFRDGDLQKSADESLQRLGMDHVDLLLLHWPNEDVPLEETMKALMAVLEQGKTRFIGVSNFTVNLMEQAYKLSDGKIITNQVEYHPYIPQKPVLDWLRAHDMFLTAYSPLARGDSVDDDTIEKLAEKHGKTPGQITLRWFMQQDNVSAIPKSSHKDRIEENFDIFDFELSEDDMDTLNGLASEDGRLIDPDWAPDWDTAKAA